MDFLFVITLFHLSLGHEIKFYIRSSRRCKTFCKDKYTRIQNLIRSEKGDVTFDELCHICDAPEDPGNHVAWVICSKQNITTV